MSANKCPGIFLRQMVTNVYIFRNFGKRACCEKDLKDNKCNSRYLGRKYGSRFEENRSRNRQCPRTNILAGFRAKWRLLFIYSPIFKLNNKHSSLHLGRKYARIFVRGHYLFREANSFPFGLD